MKRNIRYPSKLSATSVAGLEAMQMSRQMMLVGDNRKIAARLAVLSM